MTGPDARDPLLELVRDALAPVSSTPSAADRTELDRAERDHLDAEIMAITRAILDAALVESLLPRLLPELTSAGGPADPG